MARLAAADADLHIGDAGAVDRYAGQGAQGILNGGDAAILDCLCRHNTDRAAQCIGGNGRQAAAYDDLAQIKCLLRQGRGEQERENSGGRKQSRIAHKITLGFGRTGR
jgi:hypothetical protein